MNIFKRNASLRVKLLGLAGLAVFLMLVLVGTNKLANYRIDMANQSVEKANQSIEAANVLKENVNLAVKNVMGLRLTEKTYLQFFRPELKSQFDNQAGEVMAKLQSLDQNGIIDEFEVYRKQFEKFVNTHLKHDALKQKMAEPLNVSERLLGEMIGGLEAKQAEKQMEGGTLSNDELEMMNVVRDCLLIFQKLQNIQQKFLATGDKKFIQDYKTLAAGDVQSYLQALTQFSVGLQNDAFIRDSNIINESLGKFMGFIDQSLALTVEENNLIRLLNESGEKTIQVAGVILGQADQSIAAEKKSAVAAKQSAASAKKSVAMIIAIVVVVGILAYLMLSLGLIRSINKALNRIIQNLDKSAHQIASASAQVSSASQQLAEGAGEQASSLEETSSSLEELASMTKQNADNAQQADALTNEARQIVSDVNEKLVHMTAAVNDIGKNSEETQKIIKTIDEIAFQTNLLALNAAVEAARAGEAGAGFAVVAEEVRNLAMRSAEAAKNTNELIGNTVNSVKEGERLNNDVNESFKKNAEIVDKTSDLAGEIAAASQEQAQGIDQINRAIAEMDKVTQQNAANAEESAAASEEMSAQAEGMNNVVEELIAVIGSNGNGVKSEGYTMSGELRAAGNGIAGRLRKALTMPREKTESVLSSPSIITKAVETGKVVPAEETDF